jgi:hypothetical protein
MIILPGGIDRPVFLSFLDHARKKPAPYIYGQRARGGKNFQYLLFNYFRLPYGRM